MPSRSPSARREFSKKVRVLAFKRSDGNCEQCGVKLFSGNIHYDHVIPDALGGEPTLENCEVLCKNCHLIKTTTEDVPRIAKGKRQHANHIGAKKPKRPMPGSRASPWKQKIGGGWVKRDGN